MPVPQSNRRTLLLYGGIGGVCLILGCCGGMGIVSIGWWIMQPSNKAEDGTGGQSWFQSLSGGKSEEDRDKEEFLQFVRGNAQDPRDLEIVKWGKKDKNWRHVRFRCRLIAITPGGTFSPGVHEKGGDPVKTDDSQIEYSPEGKILRVHLDLSRRWWHASR